MTIAEEISKSIENQFATHNRINLFYTHFDVNNQFLPASKSIISNHKQELLQISNDSRETEWINMMTSYAYRTFCQSNQYMDLRTEHLSSLRTVYSELWKDLISEIKQHEIDFERLQQNHLKRLTDWIRQTNNFARSINDPDSPEVIQVVCAEYSSSLQLRLLHIDSESLRGPVLDIGCGEHAYLVQYLQNNGIETFGIDRLINSTTNSGLIQTDWMDYTFQPDQWRAVLANHSFALHFLHQHERNDGNYTGYAKKYMEILHSLQQEGTFYYAPSLPFIECYLPQEIYDVENFPINDTYSATHITRIR